MRGHIVLLGAGLSNTLIAQALLEAGWDDFQIVEQKTQLSGNQTWSFHGQDVSSEQLEWLRPFISRSWPKQSVRFPTYDKTLNLSYHSIQASEYFPKVLRKIPASHFRLGRSVQEIRNHEVHLDNGEIIEADWILDGRGLLAKQPDKEGYQKFIGWDVRFEKAHGLIEPIIMDARVDQSDGYRFVYCLPWDSHRMLIEDTYYNREPDLPTDIIEDRLTNYIEAQNWGPYQLLRKEQGCLPIPFDKSIPVSNPKDHWMPTGLKGQLFHPVTGYSLPFAVDLAFRLKNQILKKGQLKDLKKAFVSYQEELKARQNFFVFLNKMMFGACENTERRRIFSRFYLLPTGLIHRFYSANLNAFDRTRLLTGRPPVKVTRAIKSITNKTWMKTEATLDA